jgi:hypothetical protein
MKYIKSFSSINESHQDGLEIIDALKNSPEGKDLFTIANDGNPVPNFDRMFELKRTGRVWFHGGGSKTFIERQDGRYCFESISQGKYFGGECYPTIKECLRGLWTNIIGKRSTTLGIKKDVFREWINNNITPGRELSLSDISNEYMKANGILVPDLSQIPMTAIFKTINSFFEITYTGSGKSYVLSIDATKPFGINMCNYPPSFNNYSDGSAVLSVTSKVSGKSRLLTDREGQIILCDANNLEKDFTRLFISWFTKFLSEDRNYYSFINLSTLVKGNFREDIVCTELYEILRFILDIFKGGSDSSDNVSYLLELMIKKSPIGFAKLIKSMEQSGAYPDIVKKYNDSHSDLIRGGSMLGRFGFD